MPSQSNKYQDALLAYRAAEKAKSAGIALAKEKAFSSFRNMQERFSQELGYINSGIKARKGTPFTNPERATSIARSSRSITKLHLSDDAQLNNLVKFSRYSKVLGNGLAVIDFGSRIGDIHNEYEAGGDWERKMFIESTSFATSAAAGVITAKLGASALLFLVSATPVGWVGMLIGGALLVGMAAGTSMAVNDIAHNKAGSWYDDIMNWISGIL